ncbi:MAG TPA: carboxypeptidase [Elusimicrobia bacterium]|nr:carboxypeptidase [Elusimicrobiota bacterium]HBT61661.1 carboxypeptidase [Elusimicrobiota bacterium]
MRGFVFFLALVSVPAGAAGSRDDRPALTRLQEEAGAEALPAVPSPPARPTDQRFWITVRASTARQRTAIAETGMSIEEIKAGEVAGVAHSKTIAKLKERGFQIDDQVALEAFHQQLIKDFPPQDRAYHDYARTQDALQALADAHPELASLFSIGQSWQGRDMWCLRLNTTPAGLAPGTKPGAVFVGNHHAREHLSVEVPLKLAEYLAANKNRAAVKKLLESRDIYIIPMLNPDGAEFDVAGEEYKWHRKNMRVNPDKEIGVDLNRNYDFLFGGAGSSGDTYSDTYRGPGAFSEPETRALKAFLEARPNVQVLNSYHSYSELILYPWGGKSDPIADARDLRAYKALAAGMAKLTGYRAMQSSELYVAAGDCADWTYAARKIFSFTTELYPRSGNGGFYPGSAAIAKVAAGNIKAALYLLEYADDPRRAAP